MKNKIAILGAGGHGKVVGEIAYLNQYETINFFDKDEKKILKIFHFLLLEIWIISLQILKTTTLFL